MSKPFVAILMGSDSDLPVMEASFDILKKIERKYVKKINLNIILFLRFCVFAGSSTSHPGGNEVDGLPPAPSRLRGRD